MTRLRTSTAIGLAACVAGISASGCGSGAKAPAGSTTGPELTATTKAPTGDVASFTWNLPYGEPSSLDPAYAYNYSENTVLANVCEALLRQTPSGRIEPALATKVDNPTPTTWVYTIRSGVKFFDGKPLTPGDVVASIGRQIDPKLGSFYYAPWGAAIKSVKATGPDQVTVTTRAPNKLINDMMVTGLGTVVEASSIARQGKKFGTSAGTLQCTGPFELQSWKTGSSITLKRNPGYWDTANRARADTVTFKFITDPNAAANALSTGELDGTYEAPLNALSSLRSSGKGNVYIGPSTQGLMVSALSPAIRKRPGLFAAINAAVDRQGIAKTAYGGTASPMTTIAAPDGSNFGESVFAKAAKAFPDSAPDPAKAKQLMSAGASATKPLKMVLIAGDPAMQQTANSIQQSLKDAGITVKLAPVPPTQFTNLYFDPKARAKYDLSLVPTFTDLIDTTEFFWIAVMPGSIQNPSGYDSPTVNANLNAAVATSGDERAQRVVAANTEVMKDAGLAPLIRVYERVFLNKRLAGAPTRFPYQYYPWAAHIGSASK